MESRNSLLLTITTYLFLLAILLLGSWIRIVPIFQGDTLFQFDHGRDLWDVKKIVFDGDLTLIGPFTGIKGVFNGPHHYYLLSIPMWLTGGHPLSGTYFNALFSICGIILCYIFGLRMYGKLFGIFCALLFAFARSSVGVTVFFWNPNWIPTLMIPFTFFLWRGTLKKDPWGLVLAGFFGGFIANVEAAFGVWLIPLYMVTVTMLWPHAVRTGFAWLGLFAFAIHFIPHIIFDFRNDFLMTRAVVEFLQGNNESLGARVGFPERISLRLNEMLNATGGALSAEENRLWTTLITSLVVLIVVGMGVYAIQKKNTTSELRKELIFFTLPFGIYFLSFLVYSRSAWPWYWIGLQTSFYFLCSYLLWKAFIRGTITRVIAASIVVFWLVITLPFYFRPPTFLADEPGRYSHMMHVVDEVFTDAEGTQFGAFTYTPPVYDYAFSYLFWWRGRSAHGYSPYTNYQYKDGEIVPETVYLIIEPACGLSDSELDCEYKRDLVKGWEEKLTPQGKEVWRKSYPGRLTVIKRTRE